ncbi:MAG TPA: four helix bundle protein [Verrucomicrobiae bacterium]|nr:four helix bundle protein [Verrucomicrobiae bacterium]
MSEKIYRGFEELEVWREARKLRQAIYALTKKLPAGERFVLVPQMRRAALSITNNIAEGHGRFHYQENAQFLRLARGSLEEVLDDLTLCEDENYVVPEALRELRLQITSVERRLNGYIRYLLNQKNTAGVRETPAAYLSDLQSLVTDNRSPIPNPQSP